MSTFRQRLSDLARTTPVLAWIAFSVTLGFLGLAGLMVAGYTLTDPGGWTGVGLTALWVLPSLGLVALAFYRPDTAVPALAVASLPALAFGVWTLLDYDGARSWEEERGPVSLVLVLAVGLPLAVEGLARPMPAGVMMLAITVVPWVLSVVGAGSDWGQALSIGLLNAPVVAGGVLYVLAGRRARSSTAGRAGDGGVTLRV